MFSCILCDIIAGTKMQHFCNLLLVAIYNPFTTYPDTANAIIERDL